MRLTRILCFLFAVAPVWAGDITGIIRYEGDIPTMAVIDMGADAHCAAHGGEPLRKEILVLGDERQMANVMVQVTKGLPEGKTYPVPTEPVILTQQGCHYSPHVFVVRQGQTLKVLNPDDTFHNVHAMPTVNKPFNIGMIASRKEAETAFPEVESPFRFTCDVHKWMMAYCAVLDHPFYDVTEKDGVFTISDLPPGQYTIEAWHERLGTQEAEVTVPESGAATIDFTFARPGQN